MFMSTTADFDKRIPKIWVTSMWDYTKLAKTGLTLTTHKKQTGEEEIPTDLELLRFCKLVHTSHQVWNLMYVHIDLTQFLELSCALCHLSHHFATLHSNVMPSLGQIFFHLIFSILNLKKLKYSTHPPCGTPESKCHVMIAHFFSCHFKCERHVKEAFSSLRRSMRCIFFTWTVETLFDRWAARSSLLSLLACPNF